MGREIRRVPENWKHPKDEDGKYKPMVDYDFTKTKVDWEEELAGWYEEQQEFENGKEFGDMYSKKNGFTYTEWAGEPPSPPNPDKFMPKGEWYQLYEDVSEGTPISPPFETEQELVDWLTKNKDFWGTQWSKEGAEHIVKTGFALSGIIARGIIYKPENQYLV